MKLDSSSMPATQKMEFIMFNFSFGFPMLLVTALIVFAWLSFFSVVFVL